MAIEYADDGEGGSEVSAEPASETTTIPKSMIGGQSVEPGDVVRLEVVSEDEDGIVVKYAQPKKSMGIDEMAGQFD